MNPIYPRRTAFSAKPGFRAFTLIELLIVVAIIAILAAIAVPNFLEAQVRAKVSRAKSDMRSVTIALESYRVDQNAYPLAAELDDPSVLVIDGTAEVIEALVPFLITTPIAYISTLPTDPFPPLESPHANNGGPENTFHYLDRRTSEARGEPDTLTEFHDALHFAPNASVAWMMFSHGPDLDHDEDLTGTTEPDLATALYDPTNGTTSNGDIYTFQGKGLSN